jgi:uncharacterized protein (TIGR02145 family)
MKISRLNLRNVVKIGVASLAVVAVFVSCKKDDAKQITAFSFTAPQAVGVIDESAKSITVNVPAGTVVTALTPTIKVSEKATVSPSSGVVQNFTNPVKYIVTAENGSTAIYTVAVMVDSSGGGGDSDSVKSVLINGVRWATCNVDKPGTLTKKAEDAGMFYKWNSKIGWSSTNPLVNSNGEYVWGWNAGDGEVWEKANNPCPAGYRIPTEAELKSLNSAGSVWKTVNGVKGRTFGKGNDTIFLPAAGRREYNAGTLEGENYGGLYWSSTMQYGVYARFMEFVSNDVLWKGLYKDYGHSCRCVKE